jgi:glutamine---fructose-6-phosphate transaminase (isomerizing)
LSPELETLLGELAEQPSVVQRVMERQSRSVAEVARIISERDPAAVVLVARGSSDNAAVYGRYLLEVCNRRLTSLAAPSGMTLYGSGPRLDGTVVIGVSQSGRGEDVVEYVRQARKQGAPTIAIVNDASSPLAGAADRVLLCEAGPERSVPATKTVAAQMTLLAMLSCELQDPSRSLEPLRGLPAALQAALDQRANAGALARVRSVGSIGSVIGRGFAFPIALETALKLQETSYTRAEPFSAADFLHGPIAVVEAGYGAVLIDVGGRSTDSALELARAIDERGGQPVLLRAGQLQPTSVLNVSSNVSIAEPFAPIVALILGQMFAIELALAHGLDPARPRGLHKVTSTR